MQETGSIPARKILEEGVQLTRYFHGWHCWALLALISEQRGAEGSKLMDQRLGRRHGRSHLTAPSPAPGTWVLLGAGTPLSLKHPVTLTLVITIGEGRVLSHAPEEHSHFGRGLFTGLLVNFAK